MRSSRERNELVERLRYIGWTDIIIGLVFFGGVALIWNITTSPTEHLNTEYGYIIKMWRDSEYIPPKYDSKGKLISSGYWEEDYYLLFECETGARRTFEVTEWKWRSLSRGDRIKVDYYKKGVLPFHEITRIN